MLIWGILLTLFLHCRFVEVDGACPPVWIPFRGSCYATIDDKESWYNSEEVCKILGGHLVEIGDTLENEFLKGLAQNKSLGDVWTGGNDLLSTDKWTWLNTLDEVEFVDWAPGEPIGKSYSRCIQLWASRSYQWDDADCDDKQNFICEMREVGGAIIVG